MAHADWIPGREQDFTDLCQKGTAVLANSAKIAAFGCNKTEAAEVLGGINAFLVKHSAP